MRPNANGFANLADARRRIEAWRQDSTQRAGLPDAEGVRTQLQSGAATDPALEWRGRLRPPQNETEPGEALALVGRENGGRSVDSPTGAMW